MESQKDMLESFGKEIRNYGTRYKKYVIVSARPAKPGEVIVTMPSSGRETHATAKEDDYVIKNPTKAGEQYIISKAKLEAGYIPLQQDDGAWSKYQAKGEILAVKYDGQETRFEAAWGEAMMLKPGDMLAMTYPALDEIYRIAAVEFNETYAPA